MKEEIKKLDHNTIVLIQEILHDYSSWLSKMGYTDTDICCEEPLAADEYIKENNLC